jgi:hypothetical protein
MDKSSAAKVWSAQDALACAEAFQKLAEDLIPGIGTAKEGSYDVMTTKMADVVVCATNLGFALELYLKGLLKQLALEVPTGHDGHNLHLLYDKMPQRVRTLIESRYDEALPLHGHESITFAKGLLEEPGWNDYKVLPRLPDLLEKSKDLFQSWRCIFEFSPPEGSSHQFHEFAYGPLLCAAKVLRTSSPDD